MYIWSANLSLPYFYGMLQTEVCTPGCEIFIRAYVETSDSYIHHALEFSALKTILSLMKSLNRVADANAFSASSAEYSTRSSG